MNRRLFWLRLRALVARHRVDDELDEELAFHIARETQKHIAAGLTPADARPRAIARFGSRSVAADGCRDTRGTAVVDDLVRDVRYAWRAFRRAPLAAVTVIATVALGLGLVASVFTIYSAFFLRVDAVRNPDELFAVLMTRPTAARSEPPGAFTLREYDAMRHDTSAFTDAFAMRDYLGPVEGRLARAAQVTGNFFQVLGAQAALGRPLLPDDDHRGAGRLVIVLSDTGWLKLYQRDRGVIGRRVVINELPYEVVGVMPEAFRGLGITPPDYWMPLAAAERFDDRPAGRVDEIPVEVVGRLKPTVSPEAATAALAVWASRRTEFNGNTARQVHIQLRPRQGTLSADDSEARLLFVPLFFAFGLVLLIGCANVANLLLARGISRQREIGIRLSLGASRRRIIRQLLTESLLLALAASACALPVSRLFLDRALSSVMTTTPPEFVDLVGMLNLAAPAADWRLLTFLVTGAVASTLFFGLVPALQATRLDLVRTMRGELTRDARPHRARHALIAVQVGASALLLICAAIFLRGTVAAASRDPGVRTSDTLRISIEAEARRTSILQTLRTDPLVAMVGASSQSMPGVIEAAGSPMRIPVDQLAVSADYFTVLGVKLVSGRVFAPAERTEAAGAVVVSEGVARELWPGGSGLGRVVRLDAPPSARTLTVIGIVRDTGSEPLKSSQARSRRVYMPTGPERPGTALMVRVRGNPEQARRELLNRLTGLDPVFGIMTLRALYGIQTYLFQIAFGLAAVIGGLALVLTASGLFSVLSYLVEQQAKEIGVRIALGAITTYVVRLVLSQSFRPVGVGLAAGGGFAAAVAIVLRASPVAAEISPLIDVFDPVAYAVSALIIATACLVGVALPAVRAARIDPVATLRQD